MKKPYQIDAQRAVKQFEAMASEGIQRSKWCSRWPSWLAGCGKAWVN
jgi:hypothetical protein